MPAPSQMGFNSLEPDSKAVAHCGSIIEWVISSSGASIRWVLEPSPRQGQARVEQQFALLPWHAFGSMALVPWSQYRACPACTSGLEPGCLWKHWSAPTIPYARPVDITSVAARAARSVGAPRLAAGGILHSLFFVIEEKVHAERAF